MSAQPPTLVGRGRGRGRGIPPPRKRASTETNRAITAGVPLPAPITRGGSNIKPHQPPGGALPVLHKPPQSINPPNEVLPRGGSFQDPPVLKKPPPPPVRAQSSTSPRKSPINALQMSKGASIPPALVSPHEFPLPQVPKIPPAVVPRSRPPNKELPNLPSQSSVPQKLKRDQFYQSVIKLTQLPLTPADRGSIHVLQLEGMDSVEFSKYEQVFSDAIKDEPEELKPLFDLSKYDFEVCSRSRNVEKEHQQFLGTLLADEQLNTFSRECVSCFVNSWKIVKGSLFDHSLDKGSSGGARRTVTVNVDKSKDIASLMSPRGAYRDDGRDSFACTIDSQLFTQTTDEAVSSVKEAMKTQLPKHLFKCLHGETGQELSFNDNISSKYLEESEPFSFTYMNRLSIQCKDLYFVAGIEEPFYCSICLYDVKERTKLCETFHFELNEGELFKLFKKGTSIFCSVTKCLIPLGEHTKEETFIILRIDKLLSQDIEKDFSKYQKKPSKKLGASTGIDAWNNIGFIRQPFVWAAVPLYENGKLRTGKILVEEFHPIRCLWTEDFIYDQLSKESDIKKTKVITGTFTLEIEKLLNLPPMVVDSSLNFISESKGTAKLSKEIDWFGTREHPFVNYVNNLFVYPQTLFIKHHHPNIRVKVELLEDDDYPNSQPLGVIYTPWGGKPFSKQGFTALCSKEKKPYFTDEIKIQLPGVLTNKHHLLFTIINSPNNEVLGFAYSPIFSYTHGIIKNALRTIVIEPQLQAGYLSKEVEPVKISETKKPYLCFKTCLISSIYPESNALFSLSHVLLQNGSINYDGNPDQVLQVIQRLPSSLCISFFPPILNCLFKLMASDDPTLSPLAFIAIVATVSKVAKAANEKSTKCNSMLLAYVRYLFDPISNAKSTVHETMVKYWGDFIEKGRPEVKGLTEGEIWIFLNIVLKSSIIKLCEKGPPHPQARLMMFPTTFTERLEQLVLSVFCVKTDFRNMDVLTMVPIFMKDLLGIINRGVVFEMIFGYVSWLNSENQTGDLFLATVKFTFLKILTNYKYYIPLNVPKAISISRSNVSEIVQKFWKKHFFAGLIVKEVRAGLLQKQRIREQSIALLKDLLHSHDIDARFSKPIEKSRIIGLYFPFVITAVEYQTLLQDLTKEEKINWLICFFYIVENCSRELLHQWWDACDPKQNVVFFKLLGMVSENFEEHALFSPLCFISVDLIVDYVTYYKDTLPDRLEFGEIFTVLHQLQGNQSVGFISTLYNLLAAVSKLYPKTIFCHINSSYCGNLTYQVLFHCNSEKCVVRNKASSLFYFLLKKNFEETGNVERMKLQSTISLCKLLSCKQKVKGYKSLRLSLGAVQNYSEPNQDPTLKELVESAVHQVSRLLRFNEQLEENEKNPQLVAELVLKIAESYSHTPNLHMTWLEALGDHHTKENSWAEAAIVHIQLACIQVEYFNKHHGRFPIDFYSFRSVFPDCNLESIPDGVVFPDDEFSSCSLESIINHINSAIDYCKKALLFESCTILYSMLVQIYAGHNMLVELPICLEKYSAATAALIKSNQDTRLFATYFRVGFYGKMYEEENGRQFIYRMDPKQNLMTFQQYLKSIVSKTYGPEEDKIEVIGNQAVDVSTLDEKLFYLQVASVTPYIDEEEDEKLSPYQIHFGVDKFLFESSVGKGDQQSKKKTIFKVNNCFPYLTKRLEIIETEEIILTPLESAIDLILDRVARFKAELNVGSHNDVRINQLQQLLQGSVVPMVHEGPLKICETYLKAEERGNYPPEQISKLDEAMAEFIKLCGFGVKLVNQVIELRSLKEYTQFQEMIENHYKIMRDKLKQYLDTQQ